MQLVPLLDPQVWKSVVGPRTFATVWELLWYNCSPVCGLSAWWLYGGAYTLYLSGLLQPEPRSLGQATADLCPCRKHSTLKVRSGLVSYRFPASWCTQGVLWALRASLVAMRFNSKCIFPLLPSCWGSSFALGCGVSFFGGIQYSPVNGFSAVSCNFGVLTGENEHMSFYSAIL